MTNDKPYSFWGLLAILLFAVVFLGSIASNVLLNKSVSNYKDSTAYYRGRYDSVVKVKLMPRKIDFNSFKPRVNYSGRKYPDRKDYGYWDFNNRYEVKNYFFSLSWDKPAMEITDSLIFVYDTAAALRICADQVIKLSNRPPVVYIASNVRDTIHYMPGDTIRGWEGAPCDLYHETKFIHH